MKRSRTISVVFGLVLAACAAVIFMDQNGKLGGGSSPAATGEIAPAPGEIIPTEPATPTPAPQPAPGTNDSGYGGLK